MSTGEIHGSDTEEWTCTCDLSAPKMRVLIQRPYLAKLATHHCTPGVPRLQQALDAWNELYEHHEGALFGFPASPGAVPKSLDLDAAFKDGLDVFEWAFGGDWARSMGRFQERAERPFKNLMKQSDKLLMRILLLHYAREIKLCRTSGICASRKLAAE